MAFPPTDIAEQECRRANGLPPPKDGPRNDDVVEGVDRIRARLHMLEAVLDAARLDRRERDVVTLAITDLHLELDKL